MLVFFVFGNVRATPPARPVRRVALACPLPLGVALALILPVSLGAVEVHGFAFRTLFLLGTTETIQHAHG